jgi:hypothetical protein
MLLRLNPHPPFDIPCTERLMALEAHLRRRSEGQISVREYRSLLQNLGVNVPRSARTLQEDLRRYAAYCDDIIYGGHTKNLKLDPFASRDAVAWLMGRPWLDSPLEPHLSSACLRCLLLAQVSHAEIQMQYRRLRQPHEPWIPEVVTGIPVRFIPGADSGYVQLHMAEGRLANFNLARVEQFISMTGQSTDHYSPLALPRQFEMVIETQDAHLLDRLCRQFHGLKKQSAQCAVMLVEESLWVMTLELLEAHIHRTQQAAERRPPHAPFTLQLNEDITLHCQEVKP